MLNVTIGKPIRKMLLKFLRSHYMSYVITHRILADFILSDHDLSNKNNFKVKSSFIICLPYYVRRKRHCIGVFVTKKKIIAKIKDNFISKHKKPSNGPK